LPNKYLAELESKTHNLEIAYKNMTGESLGYPAWNLLYYSLICSLPIERKETVIVETGTNNGFSAIIMAQALWDMNMNGVVNTVDIDEKVVELAKSNVARAGVAEYVKFHVQDSLEFLSQFVKEVEYIDFVLLDGSREYYHIKKEFSIIYPKVVACRGKVYFDNTGGGVCSGAARALQFIRSAYGGNIIEFKNCSAAPPGNAIWQPD
jgi:predicted O-methyltransferase YrrM